MSLALMLSLLLSQGQAFDSEIEVRKDPRSLVQPFDPEIEFPQDPKPEPKQETKSAVPDGKSPVDVWFEDGLRFKSRDGNFEGRIGGRFLAHYRTIFDRPADTAA